MKHLVIFAHENGISSAICEFNHNPPTPKDIIQAQKEFSEMNNFQGTAVVNWLPLSEEGK